MSGSIVNRGLTQVHDNSAKPAVMHLSTSMAMEWAPRNIRVNSVSPCYTATPMNAVRIPAVRRRELLHRDRSARGRRRHGLVSQLSVHVWPGRSWASRSQESSLRTATTG